ncbi:ergothioneine biosynthesis protein EgtB [Aquabacter sp. CN5-332]|uniref:ergothioneine biosynthesis protein EgtB n=1 Tax=Aquabacter sp. CN5-332 TaxID=3156608 RepID=UPI0032B3A724
MAFNETDLLANRYNQVRGLSVGLAEGLSDSDACAQSMPDASPAKWHLAHTTWFFETFILADHLPGYEPFDPRFPFLFNSYYEAKGARIGRAARGLMTRPSLDEILAYRRYVDAALLEALPAMARSALCLVELGCHHEEQHQELLLTDILHLFAQSPLAPALWPTGFHGPKASAEALQWVEGRQGAVSIGHAGDGFSFDSEGPRHTTWLAPHALADRLVTNGEWLEFITEGGYEVVGHWLSDGWAWVRHNAIEAPLYWRRDEGGAWASQFGLNGVTSLNPHAPVQHISFYEADAYARWAGARLPTEAEWESAAQCLDPRGGNFLDRAGAVGALPPPGGKPHLKQMFGDLWEWTGSAFLAYPGFRPAPGAVGEYNGKFMSGQFVLRGGSCATPRGHVRASYRNFFYPHQRWQFTGVRLAKDL